MSILSKIEAFVIPPWVRVALELFPYALALVLLLGLEATRGTLQRERDQNKVQIAQIEAAESAKEKAWASAQTAAIATYTAKIQELQPVILNSIDTGKAYASTPTGKSACLSADRVRSILASRNAEFATTTRSSTAALRASDAKRK